jgi:hypothetical protein
MDVGIHRGRQAVQSLIALIADGLIFLMLQKPSNVTASRKLIPMGSFT